MEPIPVSVPKASPDPLAELEAYLEPFAPLFRRSQSRQGLERYVTGLLTDLERKNCDTIAAAVAGTSAERLQHLLTDAGWDALAVDRERVGRLVEKSPRDGILVKVGNCQVVVSAEYAADEPTSSTPIHWPLSARLYLPEKWAADRQRQQRAQIPEEVGFRTKP